MKLSYILSNKNDKIHALVDTEEGGVWYYIVASRSTFHLVL
jgi:hypothetical protein